MAIKKYTLNEQDFEILKKAVVEAINIYRDKETEAAKTRDLVQISMAAATSSLLHGVKNSISNVEPVIRVTSNYPVQFAISEAAGQYGYILTYDDSITSMGYNALIAISNACIQYSQTSASKRLLYKILEEAE